MGSSKNLSVIGIDPGAAGGIAVIGIDTRLIHTEKFTTFSRARALLNELQSTYELLVGFEHIHSVPGVGAKSTFSFGKNVGGWEVLFEVSQIPFIEVPVGKWQPKMLGRFSKGESKAAALEYVSKRYPSLALKKSDSGIADALCIALYTCLHEMR